LFADITLTLRSEFVLLIGLCCVTITWPQIFEDALQVTAVGVLPHVTIERRLLGRQCCETAAVTFVSQSSWVSDRGVCAIW